MGQIVGGAAKPKRCNLNKLSQLGTPAAGEHILVSSDNSMNAAGQGNFDCYIVGDGQKAATALELKSLADDAPTSGSKNAVSSGGVHSSIASIDDELFNIDSQDWVFSEKKTVRASTTTNYLSYLGKCDCNFKIESSTDNYFQLVGTNKATGNAITIKAFPNEKASFPVEFPNPRPDLELTNIRIAGYTTTTPADFTLTITKASPIKSLIDDLEELAETLDRRTSSVDFVDKTSQMVDNYYVNTNVSVGSTVDVSNPTSNAEYSYIILPATAGQKFKVKGSSGTNPRLWAFTDSSYKLLSKSAGSLRTTSYIELTAEADGYLICNASRTSVSYPRGIQEGVIVTINEDVQSLETRVGTLETNDAIQDGKLSDIDDELFNIDSQDWVFTEKKSVVPSQVTEFLTYLGKCDCIFRIDSSADNFFALLATNKATGNSITLRSYQNSQASFPLEFANPRPDLELTNIRIAGYSITTLADFTLTITKASPIKPLIDAAYADKCMADMLISNFKSTTKFSDSDYEEMNTSDIYDAYDTLVAAYPNYISKTEIGEVESEEVGTIPAETNKIIRYDFNPTWAANTEDARKIKIMILTGTHPEYMSIRALLKIMTSICESWESSEALEFLRFNVHFVIIPCASPWAVNHHSRVNANGVDMARNYPVGWKQGTYVAPPSSTSTYGGSEPLSETEAQLVNSVFESEKEDLIAAIDFHNHFSSSNLFWVARNAGDTFMTGVAGNFLKMIPRQETKYNFITPYTALGTTDATNPGGSFGRNADGNGIKGLTFETSGVVVSGLGFSNLGEVLTVSHDGFVNFLLTLLRELQLRQYSIKI